MKSIKSKQLLKSRILIALLCFVMVVSVIPVVVLMSAPKAEAVAVNSWANFKSNLEAGNSVELTGGFSVPDNGTVAIPSSVNVTIDLKTFNITHSRSGADTEFYTIQNSFASWLSASSAIHSGNIISISQGANVEIKGSGTISTSAEASCSSGSNSKKKYYVRAQTIYNRGNLTINGATISAYSREYATGNTYSTVALSVGVYNDGGVVTVNSGNITANAISEPRSNPYRKNVFQSYVNEAAWGAAYAAGIYSPMGSVVFNNGTIKAIGKCDSTDSGSHTAEGTTLQAHAAGIDLQSQGTATVTGGTINSEAELWNDRNPYTGTHYKNALGIAAINNGQVTLTGNSSNITTSFKGQGSFGTVLGGQSAIGTGASGSTSFGHKNFLDEYGSPQQTGDTIKNGWVPGAKKVLHFYRFYKGANASSGFEQVNFASPTSWMQERINGSLNFSTPSGAHFSSNVSYSQSSNFGYVNTNYYDRYDASYVNYSLAGNAPSINHNTFGTNMSTSLSEGVAGGSTVTIIYFNFYKKNATQLTSCEATNETFPFLSRQVIPGNDFGLKLYSGPTGSGRVDESSKFNITGSDTAKVPVSYSYRRLGDTAYISGLPKDVGVYEIKLNVASDMTFSPTSKNIAPYGGNFQIEIQKLVPTVDMNSLSLIYGNTLDSLGSRRSGEEGAIGSAVVTPPGGGSPIVLDGTFTWDEDSSIPYIKDVSAAGYLHTITFTPDDSSNIDSVYVDVYVSVAKRPLTIQANAINTHMYGDNVAATYANNHGMNVTLIGAAPHENTSAWLADIKYEMDMDNDGEYGNPNHYIFPDLENPDAGTKEWWRRFETDAGTYSYRASSDINEHVNKNYDITCTTADFIVAKRELTASATPVGRSYQAGNKNVDVSFEITAGKPEGANHMDAQLTLSTVTGQIPSDAAGTHTVTISEQPVAMVRRSGEMVESSNYSIVITNFDSSTVVIGKAQPVVIPPVISEPMTYDTTITLGSLESLLTNAPENIQGTWRWVYSGSITSATIPQVANQGFYAKFYPHESISGNYSESESMLIDVPILKRTLNVKTAIYNDNNIEISDWTITYGDKKPQTAIIYEGFAVGENENNVTNISNGGNLASAFSASTSYNQYSSAGTYAVTVNGTPTAANYDLVVTRETALSVLKKSLTVTPIITWSSLTYGDPAPNLLNINYDYQGLAREQDLQEIDTSIAYNTTNYEVGDNAANNYYYIVSDGMLSANYEFTYPKVYFDVLPKTLRVTAKPITIEYGDDLPTDFSNAFEINASDFVLGHQNNPSSVISGQPEILCQTYSKWSPVGQYAIEINKGSLESAHGNYVFETINTNVYLIVKKASVTITSNPIIKVETSKALAEASIENGEVFANVQSGSSNIPGAWTFVDPSAVPSFYSQSTDTYEIYFVPRQDFQDRYENSATFSIHVEVLPVEMSGEVGIYGSPMVGQVLTVVADALIPNEIHEYTCQWYATDANDNRTAIAGATGYSFTIDESYQGYRIDVVVTVRPGTSYSGSKASALTEPVSALKPVPTTANFEMLANGGEYNGNPYSAQYQAIGLDGDLGQITVKYNNSVNLPVKAGVYRITLDIAASDDYGPVVGLHLGNLEITKRTFEYYIGIDSKNYDSTNNATLTGLNIIKNILPEDEGHVSVITSTIRAAFSSPNATTNAELSFTGGLLTGDAASNYKLVLLRQQAPVEIYKAKITATATVLDRDYIPDDFSVGIEFVNFTGVYYADTGVMPLSGFGHIEQNNVGTHAVTVDESAFSLNGGMAAQNYYLSIANKDSLSVNISKATPEVEAPSFDAVEYEGLKISEQIPLGEHWKWSNPDEIVRVSQLQYEIIYDLEDDNYKTLTLPAFIEVLPASLDIQVHGKTIHYGDYRPESFDVTYSGFKADDTKETSVLGVVGFFLEYERGLDVGTYTVALNDTLYSDNYELNLIPAELEVLPKDITTSLSAIDRTYQPGDTTVQLIASDLVGKEFIYDTVFISNSRPLGYIDSPNAGENIEITHFDSITLTGSKAHNYNLIITNADDLKVNIAKARPSSYTFPSIATLSYGNSLASAVFENYSGDGTFVYEDQSIVPVSLGLFEYNAVFIPTDSNNYFELSSPVRVEVVASQVSDHMQINISGDMIIGETLTATISGLSPEALNQVQIRWIRLDSQNSSSGMIVSDTNNYILTEEDAGHYLKLEVSLNGNFIGYKEMRTPISVSKPIISFWQKLIAWINSILNAFKGLGLG